MDAAQQHRLGDGTSIYKKLKMVFRLYSCLQFSNTSQTIQYPRLKNTQQHFITDDENRAVKICQMRMKIFFTCTDASTTDYMQENIRRTCICKHNSCIAIILSIKCIINFPINENTGDFCLILLNYFAL